MKHGILAVLIAAAPFGLLARPQDPPPIPGWSQDLAAGFAEAKTSGKPLMIVFR